MMDRTPVRGFGLAAVLALSLAACQGNIGSGSGLSIPQAPAPYQPGGPGQQTSSRERELEGAVYMSAASPLPDLPLPSIGGFGIDINLGTPAPSPSATPVASPTPKVVKKSPKRAHTSAISHHAYLVALAAPDTPAPVGSTAASAAAVTSASGVAVASPSGAPAAPAGVTHLSDVPSPSGSGSPGAAATGGASPVKANHHTHTSVNSGPKIVTKTVAYPDDAPVAPTPEPTGAIQTFPIRKALVRGYLLPAVDVPIYGLGAIRFFVPKEELTAARGYTIAIFTSAKRHRGKLLEYDTAPTVMTDSVASSFTDDPIVFKKAIGYEVVLYADQGAATPVPIPSGYPPAGANPFNTPLPSGYTPAPGQGATPVPYGYPTAIPPGYPAPSASPTYFH